MGKNAIHTMLHPNPNMASTVAPAAIEKEAIVRCDKVPDMMCFSSDSSARVHAHYKCRLQTEKKNNITRRVSTRGPAPIPALLGEHEGGKDDLL